MLKPLLTSVILLSLSLQAIADLPELTVEQASRLAKLPLEGLEREYPNKIAHVMSGPDEVGTPKELHPAFYGSYDWHSSVHGHWMLVRLLKLHPEMPEAEEIRAVLERNLTAENLAKEAEYFRHPQRKSYERPYGWGWLLKLAEELHTWDDLQGQSWLTSMEPLTQEIVTKYLDFFPRQTYPIRSGVHNNTALGLTFALDYARAVGHEELERLILERAQTYYGKDEDFPAGWEPGGDHFLSPALTEADLMRRVLPNQEFRVWFKNFLPHLAEGEPKSLVEPVLVADRSDPKIVHLDGLNFSRAWAMLGIAGVLSEDDPVRDRLLKAAGEHGRDALANVTSGNYEGEHWLASFAVYMLSEN